MGLDKVITLLLITCSLFLFGFDSLNKEEITLGIIQSGVAVIDYQQTKVIARNPDKYWETNPILGKHPSESKVTQVFLLSGIGYVLVTYMLPREIEVFSIKLHPRMYWQLLFLGAESQAVFHNMRTGIRIKF